MAIHLQSAKTSKNLVELNDLRDKDILNLSDAANVNETLKTVSLKEDANKTGGKSSLDPSEEDVQFSKSLNVREVHETSPFKQAVKGFVLNKLSKKVGSSHILSGITEKIVKKLEDSKDYDVQPGIVHTSESDLNLASLRLKETSLEVITTSLSCELQSVVANDIALSDVLSVEDAVECLEDFSSPLNGIGVNIPYKPALRSNSISLPSSPAHRFDKRASSVSGSLENVESSIKELPTPHLFLCEEHAQESKFTIPSQVDDIELKEFEKENTGTENYKNSEESYLCNVYPGRKNEMPAFKKNMLKRFFVLISTFKSVLTSLSIAQVLLLASVIIHNIDIISSYLALVFDSLVISYICYSYICILLQKPSLNPTLNFPFIDPHLENASIQVQKARNIVKGSVKVLKGEYDPEMVKNHPTDLIDISIENYGLTIFLPKKKNNKDSSPNPESVTYDLLGATVSLVPKDVSKRSIWNKKYPICIALPLSKNNSDTSNNLNVSEYLSVPPFEDEATNQKALYIFPLTDREKESLFWILLKRTEKIVDNMTSSKQQISDNSSKIDFSCMSYTSLLESNTEDYLYHNKDVSEEDSISIFDKTNPSLDFENYMKNLFETFARLNKFSPRSRSFEDLSNLNVDFSKSLDSCISKDDSFLSRTTGEYSVDWLNLALGRIFYDFLTQKYWSDDIKARIQKKLDRIEMPTFIESLIVSDVFLGTSLPQIHNVSNPIADTNGMWFNLDFNYCGSFQMTLQTKLKMAKAKQIPGADIIESSDTKSSGIPSSESSEDEGSEIKITNTKKKKFMNRIEKWISHKHFQTVAQSKFVKKYVGDLSNMPLTLTVELNTLHGILTINIPPAPTDRIWYGFRKDPVLSLNAYPRVGTREINLSAVVQMIEKKLIQEFKKALVMPNMDDLIIPVMYSPIYDM